jgi:hypothetical protein
MKRARKWSNIQALQEGWDIFLTDLGKLEIQRIDDPGSISELDYSEPKFADDEAALQFVKESNDAYHRKAIAIIKNLS